MAMNAVADSLQLNLTPALRYLLRWADTCLIHAQRLGEWCGHGPVLEEDIALTNMALDLVGQARALLTHAGRLEGQGFDEDQLAFLREGRDYRNVTLAELPNGPRRGERPGDFAFTTLRNAMLATWMRLLWEKLRDSSDTELAAIAGKALKEARYHQQHAADWVVRLGDGSDESHARTQAALERLWPYTNELFAADEVDAAAEAAGLGPSRAALRDPWLADVRAVLDEATLVPPADTAFVSSGSRGVHSEHMGFILAEMQSLQRRYPGGAW